MPEEDHQWHWLYQVSCCIFFTDLVLQSCFLCAVLVSVTAGGNPTLGQQYTLTFNVSVASGLETPTVQWVGPGNSTPIITGGDFTVSSTSPYTLTINPLRQSHAGQYTCQATVGSETRTASVTVNITGIQCCFSIGFVLLV